MRKLFFSVCTMLLFVSSSTAMAEDTYAYYGFEPDITTNYINHKKKLGYIRITAELMIKNVANLEAVEHHAPLLRDAIITVLGKEPEEKIRSLTGREEVRLKCVREIKRLLKKETGSEIIQDLLFTKYLYN
ncbi:MAG: flagellar basal body-associated protein FliL [Psychrosphaera sp.]|nr:flagellar basal body-associated protein FliL [Psychrosphaera sp.]